MTPALPLCASAEIGVSGAPSLGISDVLGISQVANAPSVELIDTGPTGIVEATIEHGAAKTGTPATENELSDKIDAVSVMQPIAIAEEAGATAPAHQKIAAIKLPDPEPLEATKVTPVALKTRTLKEIALKSKMVSEPLAETVLHDELVASAVSEPLEPVEIESTVLTGKELVDPLTVIVSLKDQRLDVYRGLERIETTRISSGKRGYETLTGVFGILQKKPEHYSNLYDSAPMPWMQRLTRSGTAIHAGAVPNRPASHGCVRMPNNFAPKLFRMTEIGGKVAMLTGPMVKPERIASPVLVLPESHEAVRVADSVDGGLREGALAAAAPADMKAVASDNTPAAEDAKAEEVKAEKPWHILVTRREERDIAIGAQEALAAMGYLEPQDKFVGYLGSGTRKAILAFEKDHGLRRRGVFNERIAAKIYEAAGKGPLPDAYLFLRKGFSRVAHVPVQLRDPKKPLGTHLFTYVHPSDGGEPGWVGISLEGEDSEKVLDRITVPAEMQNQIAKGLTSGASFIVADVGKHSSVLPEGDDFIVRTNDSAKSNAVAEKEKARQREFAKQRRATQQTKRVVRTKPPRKARTVRRTSGPRGFGGLFGRR